MKNLLWSLSIICMIFANKVNAQHLWWSATDDGKKIEKITFIYGEIEVLATGPTIYYCGINWQPGNPAGGYCGIQDHKDRHKCTIFSVWDTSPELHPYFVYAEKRTIHNRFGGEGEGSHSHLNYEWSETSVFKFAVTKSPDGSGQNTLTSFYFYDRKKKRWILEASISSPTDNKDCVRYFGGGMNSFLENWSGKKKHIPKLCLYRLWVGTAPANLRFLRKASGDGHWGILNDSYYLAEGDDLALKKIILKHTKSTKNIIKAKRNEKLPLIPDQKLSPETIKELELLLSPKDVQPHLRAYRQEAAESSR